MTPNQSTYLKAFKEGVFSVGLDKKFVRIGHDDPPAKGALKISLNPFLIHTDNRVYLFDVGIGEFGEDTGPEIICGYLNELGLTEYDITDIFLSHLHYDHIGGLANRTHGYWEMTYPDAKVWTSEKAWNKVSRKELWYDEEKTEFIQFLNARADLHFLKDEEVPYPEIMTRVIGGHTEFHQVLFFDDGNHKYMQAGDVIATANQVNRKFAAKYDFDPETSMKQREILSRFAFEEGYTILGFHDDKHPVFRLTDYGQRSGYRIEALDTNVAAGISG